MMPSPLPNNPGPANELPSLGETCQDLGEYMSALSAVDKIAAGNFAEACRELEDDSRIAQVLASAEGYNALVQGLQINLTGAQTQFAQAPASISRLLVTAMNSIPEPPPMPSDFRLQHAISSGNASDAVALATALLADGKSVWSQPLLAEALGEGLLRNPKELLTACMVGPLQASREVVGTALRSAFMEIIKDLPIDENPLPASHPMRTFFKAMEDTLGKPWSDRNWYAYRAVYSLLETHVAVVELSAGRLSTALDRLSGGDGWEPFGQKGELEPFIIKLAPELRQLLKDENVTTVEGLRSWLEKKLNEAYRSRMQWKVTPAAAANESDSGREPEMEMPPPKTFPRFLFSSKSLDELCGIGWLERVELHCTEYVEGREWLERLTPNSRTQRQIDDDIQHGIRMSMEHQRAHLERERDRGFDRDF